MSRAIPSAHEKTFYELLNNSGTDAVFILRSNGDLHITDASEGALHLTGLSPDKLIGSSFFKLLPENEKNLLSETVAQLVRTGTPPKTHSLTLRGEDRSRPVFCRMQLMTSGLSKDRSESRQMEILMHLFEVPAADLINAMDQEDRYRLLMRESNHRIVNNLSILGSFVNLQKQRLHDPRDEDVLEEIRRHISSIMALHRKLQYAEDPSTVPLDVYVREILEGFQISLLASGSLTLRLELDVCPVQVPAERAVTLGLILNEFVTNSIKHGFVGRNEGTVAVRSRKQGDIMSIDLSDDGRGLEAALEEPKSGSTGIDLMRCLAEQLGGTLRLGPGTDGRGVLAHIEIPCEHPESVDG